MTPDEILAVIRERVRWWRHESTIHDSPNAELARAAVPILDDLDPDRIDAQGKMREELARDLIPVIFDPSERLRWADALRKKGWKK